MLSVSESIMKIGQYVAKIWKYAGLIFMTDGVGPYV